MLGFARRMADGRSLRPRKARGFTPRFSAARTRTITMTAIDAAVLGGARALQNSGGDAEAAMAVARRIYSQATQKRSDHVRDAIGFEAADGNTAMVSTGAASIAT